MDRIITASSFDNTRASNVIPSVDKRIVSKAHIVANQRLEVHGVIKLSGIDVCFRKANRQLKKLCFIHSIFSMWALHVGMTVAGERSRALRRRNHRPIPA